MIRPLLLLVALALGSPAAHGERGHRVESLTITVLSTMLTDTHGVGEWGFSALVEADGARILYDTGYRPETVRDNARELGIDLSSVRDVVLSHNHGDHTGGLLALRRALREKDPEALSVAHVGRGMFTPRTYPKTLARAGFTFRAMSEVRDEYEAMGGTVRIHDGPAELAPGVWITGPVPRIHPERNWSPGITMQSGDSWVEDTLPEDSALVIDTTEGLVVLTGCGHAGIVNILDHARSRVRDTNVHAALGGMHLFAASDETLEWTAQQLRRHRVAHFQGSHCTGIEATWRLREGLGLPRSRASVGAVGSRFTLESGIDPLRLAR